MTQFPIIKLNNGDPSRRSKRRRGFRAELNYGTDLEEALDFPGMDSRTHGDALHPEGGLGVPCRVPLQIFY